MNTQSILSGHVHHALVPQTSYKPTKLWLHAHALSIWIKVTKIPYVHKLRVIYTFGPQKWRFQVSVLVKGEG